ncbi:hypothetical protein MMC32_005665 [Xylographa parallela]|nr:hypothetical protein [Xylographa parallela]
MSDEQPNHRWKKANNIIQAFSTKDEGCTRGATERQLFQRPPSDAPPPRRRHTATISNVHGSLQATSAYNAPQQPQAYSPQQFGQSSQPTQTHLTAYGPNSQPPSHQYSPLPPIHQYSPPPPQSSTPHHQYPPPLTHYNSCPPQPSAVYGQSGNYSSQGGAYSPQTVPPPRNSSSYNSHPPREHSSNMPGNYGNLYNNPVQGSYEHVQQGQSYGSFTGDSTRYAPSSSLSQQESYQNRFTTETTRLETCRHGTQITIMSWVYLHHPRPVK